MFRIRAALVFAAVVAPWSCGAGPREVYWAELVGAQARWYEACGVRPVPRSVLLVGVVSLDCGGKVAVGCTTADRRVTIATFADVPAGAVMMHELGHVLGAGHLAAGVPGMMQPNIQSDSWRPCLTRADLDAVGCLDPIPEC